MNANQRARGFVARADHALAVPEDVVKRWEESIRSKTDERLVHSFPVSIDNAVRKIKEPFAHWDAFDSEMIDKIVEFEGFQVVRVLSAHPSGWVRQAVVQHMTQWDFDSMAPHLANRTIDFVPAIREAAQPVLLGALTALLKDRKGAENQEELPSAVNIVISKLLRPRAVTICPELVQLCIELGKTAKGDRPGLLRKNDDPVVVLAPYRQMLQAQPDSEQAQILEELIGYVTSK